MKYTIKTRKFGELAFSRPNGYYVFVDINGKPGTLGNQICDSGNLMGSTIGYSGNSPTDFEKICKNWWSNYLKNYRKM